MTIAEDSLELSDDDVRLLCSAIGFAPKALNFIRISLTKRYGLGPRGAFILGMIRGGTKSPADVAEAFRIKRNLLTFEVNHLVRAGLVTARRDRKDARRMELMLTPKGQTEGDELARELGALVSIRLQNYTREDVLLCTRLLRDLATGPDPLANPPDED
jgi:DNA-binding MarR family transcriptional regulator